MSNVSHVELTAHSLLLFLTYCIQIPNLDPTIYRFTESRCYSQTTTVFSLRSCSTLILLRFPLSQVTWYSDPTPVSSLSGHVVPSSYSGFLSLRSHGTTLILLRFPLSQVTWYYRSTLGSSLWDVVVSVCSIFSVCSSRHLCKITLFPSLMKLTSMMYIQCC